MASQNLPALLMRWRDAEAQWGRTPIHDDAAGALRRAVIDAWQEYNTAAGTFGENEIVLLADDTMSYVAVFGPAERILGWTTESLVGRPISSVTPPDSIELMAASWAEFSLRGELEGQYPLLARDGRRVMTTFRARAHQPLPGVHLSRHWVADEATDAEAAVVARS